MKEEECLIIGVSIRPFPLLFSHRQKPNLSMMSDLHFVLFPLMAQGHIIPMVDFGRLLARRGIIITIITTPHNASRFESIIARDRDSFGLRISFFHIDFPWKEAGFPQGCESIDLLPSSQLIHHFIAATYLLRYPTEKVFEELNPRPSCIISDRTIPFTTHIARKFNIPRISFHVFNCFFDLVVSKFNPPNDVKSENDYFFIPDLPNPPIQITKAQMPQQIPENLQHYRDELIQSENGPYGVVFNTFEELESEYVDEFRKMRNIKVWCVGPVSLCNTNHLDMAERGRISEIDHHFCFKWLDLQQKSSVIYVSFGSLCNLIPSQLKELALGLELSKRPFIWVIRKYERFGELEEWISESGFEERVKERGILIRGWAPQVLILSHPALGAFLTHCGGNGIQEGICSGIPMITWPLFADQFINEKLVVEVLKVGVKVGVEVPVNWGEEDEIGVLVKKEQVKEAIDKLMDEEGEEAEDRRKRVREFAEMAKKAVEEGGSSHINITSFINDMKAAMESREMPVDDDDCCA